jgi:large subunit ribosomal protein L23
MSNALNQEKLINVLLGPHVSEKTSNVAEQSNQITFKVRVDSTKAQIKQAVEMMFDVSVEGVQVVNTKGKSKRFGQTKGRRKDWKKAYVTLAEGQDIDFIGAE